MSVLVKTTFIDVPDKDMIPTGKKELVADYAIDEDTGNIVPISPDPIRELCVMHQEKGWILK